MNFFMFIFNFFYEIYMMFNFCNSPLKGCLHQSLQQSYGDGLRVLYSLHCHSNYPVNLSFYGISHFMQMYQWGYFQYSRSGVQWIMLPISIILDIFRFFYLMPLSILKKKKKTKTPKIQNYFVIQLFLVNILYILFSELLCFFYLFFWYFLFLLFLFMGIV